MRDNGSSANAAQVDRLEHALGTVLRIGSKVSTLILAAGLLLALVAPERADTGRIIRAGLLVLLMTPVARVVVSVVEYARERDWLFAALTLFVLVIVAASMVIGMN